MGAGGRLLESLGLRSHAARAWVMYDWANSAMVSTIVTAVVPYYFISVAGAGLAPGRAAQAWAVANALALLVTAMLGPALGAMADFAAVKKRRRPAESSRADGASGPARPWPSPSTSAR